jgi:hypothetical protein
MQVASLPELLKPAIGGEATSMSSHRTCRGDWGQRAPKDWLMDLGDPAMWVEPNANGKT